MYRWLRPYLFCLPPETAHALTLGLMRGLGALTGGRGAIEHDSVTAFGLRFANRVGLAAGYDKDGLAWRGLAALGFGHIEVGTVTLRPQPGNPRPRVFRLAEAEGLINRMGFPSRGAAFVARRLAGQRPPELVLGVNIGLNKDTPLERAAAEYAELQRIFNPLADYLAVNVSSPNTAGLRGLQAAGPLAGLLAALNANKQIPLLVKLSPDMSAEALQGALEVLLDAGVDGLILTNTTVSRVGVQTGEAGGLSGAPLARLALENLERAMAAVGGRLPVIAVGGIGNAAEAQARLAAGASLVQVYTGLVFRGPGLVRELAAISSK